MHDPQTVAFDIPMFWRRKNKWGFRPALVTIWHVDPEKDGTDDSCDWFGRKLTKKELEAADALIDNEFDNLRTFFSTFVPQPCPQHGDNHDDCDMNDDRCRWGEFMENASREEMRYRVATIFKCYKRRFVWRYPVRWHFWHWKLQIHPIQQFKRWAFSRCCNCGGRFKYGESPTTYVWDSGGPRWFRSEKGVFHGDCGGGVGVGECIPKKS